MKPKYFTYQGKEYKLVCFQKKNFPPIEMSEFIVKERGDLETQRKDGYLSDNRYQQILTWQRICGLHEMDDKVCRACHFCRLSENHPHRGAQLKDLPAFMRLKK